MFTQHWFFSQVPERVFFFFYSNNLFLLSINVFNSYERVFCICSTATLNKKKNSSNRKTLKRKHITTNKVDEMLHSNLVKIWETLLHMINSLEPKLKQFYMMRFNGGPALQIHYLLHYCILFKLEITFFSLSLHHQAYHTACYPFTVNRSRTNLHI